MDIQNDNSARGVEYSPEELREQVGKWLFTMKDRFPNQRFYHSWHDEISASPLTKREYLSLAEEILFQIRSAVTGLEFEHPQVDGISGTIAYQAGLHDARRSVMKLLGSPATPPLSKAIKP